jgi:hypothetical protein
LPVSRYFSPSARFGLTLLDPGGLKKIHLLVVPKITLKQVKNHEQFLEAGEETKGEDKVPNSTV